MTAANEDNTIVELINGANKYIADSDYDMAEILLDLVTLKLELKIQDIKHRRIDSDLAKTFG